MLFLQGDSLEEMIKWSETESGAGKSIAEEEANHVMPSPAIFWLMIYSQLRVN